MITVEFREAIRRAYFIDGKSIRQIARDSNCSRITVRKAIASAGPVPYTLRAPRSSPVLGPFTGRIDELLTKSERNPPKQRYTAKKIYDLLRLEGYAGSESGVRKYVGARRADQRRPQVYLPLDFDPGRDAQVDWGEAMCIMDGARRVVKLFFMRLCYSRRLFMMAFPNEKQESFFEGHRCAFRHFGGVPHRIAYDNLKTAVLKIFRGRGREEQRAFVAFRSHYLFESRFCTPGEGHEKGRVEDAVGFGRRNFMVPIPEVSSFDELNKHLLASCLADDARRVHGQPVAIGEAFEAERPFLRLLPERDYDCATSRPASLNPYSQVVFETNRYSVPVDRRERKLVVKAYPFHVEILGKQSVLARHARSYERDQDVIDPLHYLPLLEQRPGAFEHAKPVRQWRRTWPDLYNQLLDRLVADRPSGAGVREFIQILKLHRTHPAKQVEEAVRMAIEYGSAHADGVRLCLHQLTVEEVAITPLALDPGVGWAAVGAQPICLDAYDELLTEPV